MSHMSNVYQYKIYYKCSNKEGANLELAFPIQALNLDDYANLIINYRPPEQLFSKASIGPNSGIIRILSINGNNLFSSF